MSVTRIAAQTTAPYHRSGRGSLRTQLIAYNVLAITLLLGLLGAVVHYTVTSAVLRSVDAELEESSRHMSHGPPGRMGPGGPMGPPPGSMGQMQGPPGFAQGNPPGWPPGGGEQPGQPGPPGSGFDALFPRDPHRGPPPQDDGPYRPRRFDLSGQPLSPGGGGPDDPRGQGGGPVAAADRVPWDATALESTTAPGEIRFSTVTVDDVPVRVLTRLTPDTPPYRGILQIPYPLTDVYQALADLDRALLLLAPVALLGAGLAGAYLTDRVLRRVRRLAEVATRIGESGTIAERLPVIGDDEFSALAETFNGMLARLDAAFARQASLMEQQRRFTADASHELKTPLTIIKGTASLALGATNPTVAGCQQSLAEIDRAANVMADLVQDLILLARSDAGQLGRDRIELLVLEVLEQATARVPRPAPGAGPQVRVQVAEPGLQVVGSEGDLIRLFANLLDNAVRYTPPDGRISLSAQRVASSVVVTVRDTGIGIAPQHLSRLGERFYRIDESRARSGGGGTGLGLSICKSIAAAHGGSVSFASRPGAGTTVTVTLPAVADTDQPEAAVNKPSTA